MFSSDCLSSRQRIVEAVVIQATPDAVGGETFHEVNSRAVLRAVRTRCSTASNVGVVSEERFCLRVDVVVSQKSSVNSTNWWKIEYFPP
jgi:hypothetical protein